MRCVYCEHHELYGVTRINKSRWNIQRNAASKWRNLTLDLLLKPSSYYDILRSNKRKEFQTKYIIYILKQSLSTSEKVTFENDAKHYSVCTTTTTLGFMSHDLKMASLIFFFYRKSCKTEHHLIGEMWNVINYHIWSLILQYNLRYLT